MIINTTVQIEDAEGEVQYVEASGMFYKGYLEDWSVSTREPIDESTAEYIIEMLHQAYGDEQ